MNTSAIPAAAWPSSVIAPSRRISSPARAIRRSCQHSGNPRKDHQQDTRCPGDERSRCLCCLGCQQGCRYWPPGSNRILLGRPHHLVVQHPQSGGEGRRRLVRPAGGPGQQLYSLDIRPIWSASSRRRCSGLYGGRRYRHPAGDGRAPWRSRACSTGSPAAKASEIHVYDNAPHAFHADYRPSYRKEEAEDGWKPDARLVPQKRRVNAISRPKGPPSC